MVMADTYSKYEKDVKSASWFTSAFFGEGLTKYAAEKRWEKYCDSIDNFEDSINELFIQTEEYAGYKIVLNQVSKDQTNNWNSLAEKVLEKYNAIDVIISDYKKVETSSDTKIWKFTELNTGLVCKFWIESDNKWCCDITESSMKKFLNNLIQ